ncbi:Zeatin O-glucosyltransferase [Morella rubra]|uniref:Zeatin O-glucosyltransferase n=1 Tax=Morella rubra TaxID=262757 RepID=A0A6A1WBM0_9ROSI|nr:Zeatin O-glucosyltransferase [Morella rubra]
MEGDKKQWAIGPFNPVRIPEKKSSTGRHKCLEWLDKQTPNSVIYVSFGTTTAIEGEQIKELAIGLERSEQKFIWVLRDADIGDVFNGEVRKPEIPKGFEERVEDRGMVDWSRRDQIVMSTTVENAVKMLMASKEGDVIRKRAMDLGGAVRGSMDKGGVSRMELESFIAHIAR